jgi:Ca-activated chloride channel family protein
MFRFGLALALSFPALSAQEPPSPGGPGFTLYTASQLVVLNVGVQDHHGTNIKGLTAEDFKIMEDGHPRTIKQFAAEDRPVTLGIVVDASGSMRPKQTQVVTAALAFVRASNPKDETFVVNFNDRAREGLPPAVPFSNNPQQLRTALLGPKPEGRTALYDALTLAAEHLAKGKWENKVLLLISDGGDNNSTHNFAETMNTLQMSGATVYSIALFDPDEREHNVGLLHRLSKMSGGEAFEPMDISEIQPLCLRIADDIRASYTLAYTPPQPDQHTTPRKIRVEVRAPAAGKLTARTRTSYVLESR